MKVMSDLLIMSVLDEDYVLSLTMRYLMKVMSDLLIMRYLMKVMSDLLIMSVLDEDYVLSFNHERT